jgi:mannitol 2-dehydrogenase
VLEDRFQEGFPLKALAGAGVQIVREVEPYELMKIRLLNGSHSALAYPAYLMGHRAVAEAAADPLLRRFIREHYMEQIGASVPPVPGIDLGDYKDTLIRRFSNRNIGDTILRLASDGSRKVPNAILKPLAELEEAPRGAVVFALAAWARFLTGRGEGGEAVPLEDPAAGKLSAAALRAGEDPGGFLQAAGMPEIGEDKFASLARDLGASLGRIRTLGIRRALEDYLRG